MSCGAVESGDRFLISALSYLECTGSSLGVSGYQSLASAPLIGSVLLALLTLFIAVLGLRLMFGRHLDFGDAAMAAAKVGFVLMLALSWPAVQTLVFGTVTQGPTQIVERLTGRGEPLGSRMQRIDSGVVALTAWGTGKLDIRAGQTASGLPAASAFQGEATNESLALSLGRILLLMSVFLSLGAVSLASGLLIALLPLFTGFLLFPQSRGLFFGWAKSMAFLFFSGIALPTVLAIEANIMEPWLQRVLAEREQALATPGAPLELLTLSATFTLLLIFSAWLLARISFNSEFTSSIWQSVVQSVSASTAKTEPVTGRTAARERFSEVSRATHIASVLDIASRRRTGASTRTLLTHQALTQEGTRPSAPAPGAGPGAAGHSRRAQPREAGSRTRRDQK